MAIDASAVEQLILQQKTLIIPVTLVTNATDANIKIYSPVASFAHFFSEEDGQTITAYDAAPGFVVGDLDDDASPGVFGCILNVGNARGGDASLVGVSIETNSIVAGSTGLSALGTVTKCGASSTGVSASKNICFTFGLTGVDPDGSSSQANFLMRVVYFKDQPVG